MADTPDLGSGAVRREGSSPFVRTKLNFAVLHRFATESCWRWQQVREANKDGIKAQGSDKEQETVLREIKRFVPIFCICLVISGSDLEKSFSPNVPNVFTTSRAGSIQ
jgi:hypothetical protein